MSKPFTPGTLGELAEEGLELRIWCNVCGYSRSRDGLTLALLMGRERPIYGVFRSMWCTECGASGSRQGAVFSMPEHRPVAMGLYGREGGHVPDSERSS